MCGLIRNFFCRSDPDITRFKKDWRNSPAAKLLLPDINTAKLELGKQEGYLASIAYVAWMNGNLYRLDSLIKEFEICENYPDQFKHRLKEIWLEKDPEKRRNSSNNVMSAFVELVVADYLKNLGYKIDNLEAWNDLACDVEYEDTIEKHFKVEIKYLPDPPDFYDQRITAAITGGANCIDWSDDEMLNYVFFRIAEAVIQLEKKKISKGQRVVWLVFDALAQTITRRFIDHEFFKFTNWVKENGNYVGIQEILKNLKNNDDRKKICDIPPQDWVKKIDRLVLSTLRDFHLYFTKSITGSAAYP